MKSKILKEDNNMTTNTITILYNYNYNVKWKDTIRKKSILEHICVKTVNSYYRKNALGAFLKETEEDELTISVLKEL